MVLLLVEHAGVLHLVALPSGLRLPGRRECFLAACHVVVCARHLLLVLVQVPFGHGVTGRDQEVHLLRARHLEALSAVGGAGASLGG